MEKWLYRWLPVIFGCHCRNDRSFFWHGRQFPICARCTGELIGILATVGIYAFFHCSPFISVLLLIPLILDGFVQQFTRYESNNIRRCFTGFLFGVGFTTLIISSFLFVMKLGYSWGNDLRTTYLFHNY